MPRKKSAKRNRLNTTVKPTTTAALERLAKDLDMPAGRVIDAAISALAEKSFRASLDNPATWDEANALLASLPTAGKANAK